jgi:hypothetical protein
MWSENDLVKETRWTREYATADKRCRYLESRFLDGTATIERSELADEWKNWTDAEKLDFCQSFSCADVPEAEEILRFIIANGDHHTWSVIASNVASVLPTAESVTAIKGWCESCQNVVPSANYFQALAMTGDPQAHETLKRWLFAFFSGWFSAIRAPDSHVL